MPNEILEAAIKYAVDFGIPVMPLKPHDKVPVLKDWVHKASTDPEQIRAWWAQNPNYNVGGVMGEVICLDFDKDEGFDSADWLAVWERENGKLPETATAVTGRGGMHLYYRVDRPIAPSVNGDIHIDVRGIGSQAMMAPSVHPNGNTVFWDLDPEDVGIADANDLVYKLIEEVQPPKQEREHVKIQSGVVKEGEGRNNWLYKQGCSARAKGADDDIIASWLETLNNQKCRPPLGDDELARVIASVCNKPIGLSEEAKREVEAASAGRVPAHVRVSRMLIDERYACFIEGVPAVWDGIGYDLGWDAIERAILDVMPNATDKQRKEIVKYLNLKMPREKAASPRFIGFKNGALDIETLELMSFSPAMRMQNVIPHDWNPKAQSDVLDGFLQRISCGDPFIESNLCEFIGLCMYRSAKYAFAAILLGKPEESASNGKSTYIALMRDVLGASNCASLSLQSLGGNFMPQFLAGKLANLGDDISSEFAKGQAMEVFKKAVSGSEITADVKGVKGFSFIPYCTMVFSANRFPAIDKLDDGTLRRLFPIRFNAHFTPEDEDYDPDIGEKLAEEEVIEAAIVRGIQGLRRVVKNRRPTDNAESRRMVHDIKLDNSSILQWLEEADMTRADMIGREVGGAYDDYEKWCRDSGVIKKYAKWQFSKEVCMNMALRVMVTTRDGRSMRVFAEPK